MFLFYITNIFIYPYFILQVRRLASLDEVKSLKTDPETGSQNVKTETGKIPTLPRRLPQVILRRPHGSSESTKSHYFSDPSFVPSENTSSNKNGIYSANKSLTQSQTNLQVKSFIPSKQFSGSHNFGGRSHTPSQQQRPAPQVTKSPVTVTLQNGRVVYVVTSPNNNSNSNNNR